MRWFRAHCMHQHEIVKRGYKSTQRQNKRSICTSIVFIWCFYLIVSKRKKWISSLYSSICCFKRRITKKHERISLLEIHQLQCSYTFTNKSNLVLSELWSVINQTTTIITLFDISHKIKLFLASCITEDS